MRTTILALLAISASAQQIDLSSLDKLAEKARESANVTLDESKLKFASQFLSSEDKDMSQAKGLLSGLKGINVRSFEFDKPGQFVQADLEPVRKQLRGPGWTKIVDVREGKGESAEVYVFGKGSEVGGLTVIALESDELAVVNIVGMVDMNTLMKMGGAFGIPKLDIGGSNLKPRTQREKGPEKVPVKDDDDDEDN